MKERKHKLSEKLRLQARINEIKKLMINMSGSIDPATGEKACFGCIDQTFDCPLERKCKDYEECWEESKITMQNCYGRQNLFLAKPKCDRCSREAYDKCVNESDRKVMERRAQKRWTKK
jgi:hypothetical protein